MIKSVITVVLSIVFFILYKKKRIHELEYLLVSFIVQAFNIEPLGMTITPFFFATQVILFEEVIFWLKKRPLFDSQNVMIFLLPFLSSAIVIVIYFTIGNNLEVKKGDIPIFLVRPFYFYLKYWLPWFAIISRIKRKSQEIHFESFLSTIKNLTIFSLYASFIVLILHIITNNPIIDEFLGIKSRYVYQLSGVSFLRLQAFFDEPKNYAAFLGTALPIFYHGKNKLLLIIAIIAGLLTVSETFMMFGIVFILIYFVLRKVKYLRKQILLAIGIILLFFLSVSSILNFLVKEYTGNEDDIINKVIISRILMRYNLDDFTPRADFLGLPVQGDLEMPVIIFFEEHPMNILTGYGPTNNPFIPAEYYFKAGGDYLYELRLESGLTGTGHMNLRWIYYSAEFGIVIFSIIFLKMTSVKNLNRRDSKYYSFLWCGLFFNEIELILVLCYSILLRSNE